MSYTQTPPDKDPVLWDIAQKRASFRGHLVTYLVMNVFFWLLWYFTGGNGSSLPWPVWPGLGWGIGLVFHYIGAYVHSERNATENEYNKLINKKNQAI